MESKKTTVGDGAYAEMNKNGGEGICAPCIKSHG